MLNKRSLISLLLFFILMFFSVSVYAGGIDIKVSSVTFNQRPPGSVFLPGTPIAMKYWAYNYSYSGERNRFEYALFEFRNIDTKEVFYAVQELRGYANGQDIGEHGYELDFRISQTGHYRISYFREPAFTNEDLSSLVFANVFSKAKKDKAFHHELQDKAELCFVTISPNGEVGSNMGLYLRLNGLTPGYNNITSHSEKVNFSFLIKNQSSEKNLLFRYRLYPDDTWSDWQTDTRANFFFINKGIHEFQVECQYELNGIRRSLGIAKYAFTLEKSFVSNPKVLNDSEDNKMISFIDKGDIRRTVRSADLVLSEVYDKSKALLIGVDHFSDRTFSALPFVNNDILGVSKVLVNMNFDVQKSKSHSRAGIMNDIRGALTGLKKNDRLVIYISSHGFLDQLDGKSKIATQECVRNNPAEAIPVDELKDLIKGAGRNCRHILLILDCCASGMGVIEKNNSIGALRNLATQKGTSILTAGMSNQNAEMSEQLKMSVFTHYLVDGLTNKKADYTKDSIVTLTELLIYVQYNVANYTHSQQIPMSGRISGSGEMIFY